jgi:nucleotide-binding universal stress UspA family protein
MFQSILVPLDGSRLSEASLPAAAALAQKLGSSVTLLHVIEQDAPSEIHKERHLTNPKEADEYLRLTAQRAFGKSVKVTTHVHTAPVSDVARSIVEHSRSEFQPDLIVTCTHGRGGVRGLLFGSIAQQIVAQGTTPVLLIKPGDRPFAPQKMLVPLDPYSEHDEGLPRAQELAQALHAELELLSVIPTYSTLSGEQAATGSLMPGTTQAVLDLREEHARSDLSQHLDSLRKMGIASSAAVVRGDPATMIIKTADRSEVDLIILCTHRKAGLDAFWSKSVAPKVGQGTRIPVLLIPLG